MKGGKRMEKVILKFKEALEKGGMAVNSFVFSLNEKTQEQITKNNGDNGIIIALGSLSQYDDIRLLIIKTCDLEALKEIKSTGFLFSEEEKETFNRRLKTK